MSWFSKKEDMQAGEQMPELPELPDSPNTNLILPQSSSQNLPPPPQPVETPYNQIPSAQPKTPKLTKDLYESSAPQFYQEAKPGMQKSKFSYEPEIPSKPIENFGISPNPSDLDRGFRRNLSEDFLGPKNPRKDFFGGELGESKTSVNSPKSSIKESPYIPPSYNPLSYSPPQNYGITKTPGSFKSSTKNFAKKDDSVYIRLDKFQITMETFKDIKEKIREIEELLSRTKEIKAREEKEIEEWEREIEIIKLKLDSINKEISAPEE